VTEEKKEPWLNYLALSTVILAVCATLSTFKGGSFSTRSILSQTQASDQWAFYQAKSLKGYLYELQRDKLDLELGTLRTRAPEHVIAEHEKKIAAYSDKIRKYEKERAEIQAEAKRFESVRNDAQKHAQAFGIAVIFLQIAILLSSIAALVKKKYVWVIGLGLGVFGIVAFLNGFFLFA
jgi:hypothetical protein